jgi:hypothetical protein
VSRPRAQAPAPERTSVAMAVIMTGVLMTAVDTTIVVLALPEILPLSIFRVPTMTASLLA